MLFFFCAIVMYLRKQKGSVRISEISWLTDMGFISISINGIICKELLLPHPTSINMGENCAAYQNVTFGAKKGSNDESYGAASIKYPQIGDECVFYAVAMAVGGIHSSD